MADFAIKFSDFSGGHAGVDDTVRPASNQWVGTNVMEYESGLLGVRPEWQTVPLTIENATIEGMLSPRAFSIAPADASGNPSRLFISDTTNLYMWEGGSTATAEVVSVALPSAGSTDADQRLVHAGSNTYGIQNGVLYRVNPTSPPTLTTITKPQPIIHLVRWGNFMVAVDRGQRNRIWHSSISPSGPQFETWSANNFYFVGDAPITSLVALGNTLYASSSQGWWAISGVLGEQVTIRQVTSHAGPDRSQNVVSSSMDSAMYRNVTGAPAMFNGDGVRPVPSIKVVSIGASLQTTASLGTEDATAILDYSSTYWFRRRGQWSRHALGDFLVGFAQSPVSQAPHLGLLVGSPSAASLYLWGVVQEGLAPADVRIVRWPHLERRPGRIDATGGGLVSGEVTFPAWFDPQGRQVRVKSVIIQFRKWTSGVADSMNKLQCQIVRAGAYEGGESSSTVQEWTEASASATDDGTDDSVRFGFGEQGWGNGFRLRIPVMQGVAIREIVAQVDIRTTKT